MFEYSIYTFNEQINKQIEELFDIKLEKKFTLEMINSVDSILPDQMSPGQKHTDQKHTDLTLKAGFTLAKQLNKTPDEVSKIIANEVIKLDWVENAYGVKGYVNIRLKSSALEQILQQTLECKTPFGQQASKDIKVIFDYASINPTGPMHAGHLRSAVIADSIINVFSHLGYQVHRQYYLNDTGGQMKKLVESVYASYIKLLGHTAYDTDSKITEYDAEYIHDIASQIYQEDQDKWFNNPQMYEHFRAKAVQSLLAEINIDLQALGVKHDEYFSEYEMEQKGVIAQAFQWLQSRHYVEEGIMDAPIAYSNIASTNITSDTSSSTTPSNNTLVQRLKMDKLDDRVKALTKKDGSHTYLLGDIALHIERYKAGFDWIINFFGADHADHGNVLKTVIQELFPEKKIDIKTCQMVRFEKDGQEFKMSKRAGTYVTARDILEAVGKDSVRMEMCSRTANAQLCLDVDKILTPDDNNPVFYIQYAHARCCSALSAQAQNIMHSNHSQDSTNFHTNLEENTIIRKIILQALFFPTQLEKVISSLDIHSLFTYALDTAKALHSLWNEGKTDSTLKLANNLQSIAKLVRIILSQSMQLLGVEPIEHMR